jgi:hypothetical protein
MELEIRFQAQQAIPLRSGELACEVERPRPCRSAHLPGELRKLRG